MNSLFNSVVIKESTYLTGFMGISYQHNDFTLFYLLKNCFDHRKVAF